MIGYFALAAQKCYIFICSISALQFLGMILLLLLLQNYLQNLKRKSMCLPPGPIGLPFVGSLPYIAKRPYKTFADMAKTYGDVFSLQLGTQSVVVINNQELLREAFIKNGHDFAGRPPFTIFQYSSNEGRGIAFTPGRTKKNIINRKLGHAALHKFISDIDGLEASIKEEVDTLKGKFSDWLSRPFDPCSYIKYTTANIMISLVHGKNLDTTYRDEFMELSKVSTDFTRNIFIATLVDFAPCLAVLFKERLAKLKASINQLFQFSEKVFALQKEKELGRSLSNVLNELKDTPIACDIDPLSVQMILTDLLGAGVDTTSGVIQWGIYLLAKHQHIQSSLQEELDSVLGKHGSLRLQHKRDLPKLQATINEILRTKPPLPLALPHYTMTDSTLGGYNIPKDTVVIANIWGINHNSENFKQPFEFNPWRFINEADGKVKSSPADFYPFSIGLRKCIGLTLARQLVFIILGSLLQNFKFTLEGESQRETAGDNEEFTLIMQPKAFKVILETR